MLFNKTNKLFCLNWWYNSISFKHSFLKETQKLYQYFTLIVISRNPPYQNSKKKFIPKALISWLTIQENKTIYCHFVTFSLSLYPLVN
ncbi:MAG: hypothetical protein EBS07_05760 [Sphingobacteriia bacterium]|nr:hypothetical protein [Sphingobacteriia bacterium]